MNDLPKDTAEGRQIDMEVGASSSSASQIPVAPGQDTVEFSIVVQEVISSIEEIHNRLLMVESSNILYTRVIDDLSMDLTKEYMDDEFDEIRTIVLEIREKLKALGRSNAANRKIMNSQAGSSTDRLRIDEILDLKERLRKLAIFIEGLRKTFRDEYRDAIQLRLYLATGNEVDLSVIEGMIETGEDEQIFQNYAIVAPDQKAVNAVAETQRRHAAFKDLERTFHALEQNFLDMGIHVEPLGEPVDNVEPEVIPELHPEVVAEVVPVGEAAVVAGVIPEVVPVVVPGVVLAVVPGVNPEVVPRVDPEVVPAGEAAVVSGVVPEVVPVVVPEVVPGVNPEVIPRVDPEVVAGVIPGVVPTVVSEVVPEVVLAGVPGVNPEVVPADDRQVDQGVDHGSNCICFTLMGICILGIIFGVVALEAKPWKKAPK